MITSANNIVEQVAATDVVFVGNNLQVTLNDGRVISVPMDRIPWLQWLVEAPDAKRDNWSIEPGGFAIYWDDLDDGIEIEHLLGLDKLA
jgi:hypothetical protein